MYNTPTRLDSNATSCGRCELNAGYTVSSARVVAGVSVVACALLSCPVVATGQFIDVMARTGRLVHLVWTAVRVDQLTSAEACQPNTHDMMR